ncbi:MAG: L-seryl-tRNA(Sec) selenium transferase [Deltaproteobacteria bacterium]|nr:L-seryl-tRNA(Sec) selenium transferase [Deltaproteobacteria bacterium]
MKTKKQNKAKKINELLRQLPSVEVLSQSPLWNALGLLHSVRVRLSRKHIVQARKRLLKNGVDPNQTEWEQDIGRQVSSLSLRKMRKVINATGVVLHTNLGRAPLGKEVLHSMAEQLAGYCNLELDLEGGERGSRTSHVEEMISLLCGSESAVIVNNNAAALYLIAHTWAKGAEVIVSRGELVQIGGGFRIPEIIEATGASLVEVGTTNITDLKDYKKALGPRSAMILKVNRSNFVLSGHAHSCDMASLCQLAESSGIPLVADIGSGLLSEEVLKSAWSVSQMMRFSPLVCFSADKLFGGPQAGIIVGKKNLVQKIRQAPLYRAMRLGKTEIFLLQETLWGYLRGELPVALRLLTLTPESIKQRCEQVCAELGKTLHNVRVISGTSSVGGGAMPEEQLPTFLVEITVREAQSSVQKLRLGNPPVITRLGKGKIWLDLRTVLEEEQGIVIQRISEVCSSCT